MAYDACMMRAVLSEYLNKFPEAKIEKVVQPQNDEVNFLIHHGKSNSRLVFNVGPNSPRLQLSQAQRENPQKAPMFCMLLRKYLIGARIVGVSQPNFDRIAEFTISAYDDMGFPTTRYAVCEIMGKYANLIILDGERKILAALKVIDFAASTVRQVLPGLKYQVPKMADKLLPTEINEELFYQRLQQYPKGKTVERFITESYSGIATQIAHELCYRATGGVDTPLEVANTDKLYGVFREWQQLLMNHAYTPTVVYGDDGKPLDYSYMPITYREGAKTEVFENFLELFDKYFSERDRIERTRQRGKDLISLITTARQRTERKLEIQRETLLESERAEEYRRAGDLITANIYKIKRGDSKLVATDFYDESCPLVEIELDTRLSPAANAQRMYKLYNKCKKAKAVLTEQIALWERELLYLDSVSAFIEAASTEADIAEIREELYRSGYASRLRGYKPQKSMKSSPIELKTSGGLTVLVGKNNTQNDYLTLKLAKRDDIWFHVKDAPGSHVILVTEGEEPSDADYTEAASIAAEYSSQKDSPSVAVDYTRVRNIKKPNGSKPGFVIYKTNYTAYVKPRGQN